MLTENLSDPSAGLLRGMLFAALFVAGAGCSRQDVGRCFTYRKLPAIRETVTDAWLASMSEPKEGSAKEAEPATKPNWTEAWAIAKYDMRLSDAEWLDMTPRQFSALQEVRLAQLRREELLVGILAAQTQNFSACHPDKAVSAEAFMLHKFPKRPDEVDASDACDEVGAQIISQLAKLKG